MGTYVSFFKLNSTSKNLILEVDEKMVVEKISFATTGAANVNIGKTTPLTRMPFLLIGAIGGEASPLFAIYSFLTSDFSSGGTNIHSTGLVNGILSPSYVTVYPHEDCYRIKIGPCGGYFEGMILLPPGTEIQQVWYQ